MKEINIPVYIEALIPEWFNEYKDAEEDKTEVIYFRKFWGFRNEVKHKLHSADDEYITMLDPEYIAAMAAILFKFIDRDYYEDNADSIGNMTNIFVI